jgi:SAM-dependent methyltransferase
MSIQRPNATQWESNAQRNPLWAILTDRELTLRNWDVDAFFQTGEREVDVVLDYLGSLGVVPDRAGRFLDFGCGVGRITRALIRRFASGVGVDVSETMIALAAQYSAADQARAELVINIADGLPMIDDRSVDFVYSHIVLQHVPPELQPRFIAEFLRILKPGGIAAFQLPTADAASFAARSWRRLKGNVRDMLPSALVAQIKRALGAGRRVSDVTMDMNVLPEPAVAALIEDAGCRLLAAPYTNSTDSSHRGNLRFMNLAEAVGAVNAGQTDSTLLSQFFFAAKPHDIA